MRIGGGVMERFISARKKGGTATGCEWRAPQATRQKKLEEKVWDLLQTILPNYDYDDSN